MHNRDFSVGSFFRASCLTLPVIVLWLFRSRSRLNGLTARWAAHGFGVAAAFDPIHRLGELPPSHADRIRFLPFADGTVFGTIQLGVVFVMAWWSKLGQAAQNAQPGFLRG